MRAGVLDCATSSVSIRSHDALERIAGRDRAALLVRGALGRRNRGVSQRGRCKQAKREEDADHQPFSPNEPRSVLTGVVVCALWPPP